MAKKKFIPRPKESAKVIRKRWSKKRESIETLANNIQRLRYNVSTDLKSDNEKIFLTALVVAIMDKTAERVGNEESASNGHVGITGLKKTQVNIIGNKIILEYVGKSGVEHDKSFSDERIAKALKKAKKDSPDKNIFTTSDGFKIKADRVNRYLTDFDITAKDMRGYSANNLLVKKLKDVEPEETEHKRKRQFNKVARFVAKKVGHGIATLKKHYLIPELEPNFIERSKVIEVDDVAKFNQGGSVKVEEKTKKITIKKTEPKKPEPKKMESVKKHRYYNGYDKQYVDKIIQIITDAKPLVDEIDNKAKEGDFKEAKRLTNLLYADLTDSSPLEIGAWGKEHHNAMDKVRQSLIGLGYMFGEGGSYVKNWENVNGNIVMIETPIVKSWTENMAELKSRMNEYTGKNLFEVQMKNGGDVNDELTPVREKLTSILSSLDESDLHDFVYYVGGVDDREVDDVVVGYKHWINGLSKVELDMLLWRMKQPYFYQFSPKDNYSTPAPVPSKFATYNDFYEKKYRNGGSVNPFAVCTSSIGKTEGTTKRSEWSDKTMDKYEDCVLQVKSKMSEGGTLEVKRKKVYEGDKLLRDLTLDEVEKYMGIYHEEKGNMMFNKNAFIIWMYDVSNVGQKINSREFDFLMFPLPMKYDMLGDGIVHKIWKAKWQNAWKGAKHLLGMVQGWYDEEKKIIYVHYMSVRPSAKRNRINTFMIQYAKKYFESTDVVFDEPSQEGKIFSEAKTYSEGGDFKPKVKVSYGGGGTVLYHGSSNSFDKFSFDSLGAEMPKNFGRVGVLDYGWGIYFTKNKDWALSYSNIAVKKAASEFGSEYIKKNPTPTEHLFGWTFKLENEEKFNLDKIFEKLKSSEYTDKYNLTKKEIDWLIKYYEYLDEKTKGQKILYKVKLSSDANLLTFEEKPTASQFEKIKQNLKSNKIDLNIAGNTGEEIQKSLEKYFYKKDNKSNYMMLATLFFRDCGIDGIKDDDGVVYVIWNDDVIEIEDKKVFSKGGEMPHHYIKVTKDGDYIGAIKFNPNNPERVTNLADLASTAKRAGYSLTPIDVETYRSLIKNIDYEKLKKYQEDMWLADKKNSGVHDSSLKNGGLFDEDKKYAIAYRSVRGDWKDSYKGWQYYSSDIEYSKVYGKNTKKFKISLDNTLDLNKWNKMLRDANPAQYDKWWGRNNSPLTVGEVFIAQGYNVQLDTIYLTLGSEKGSEFEKEFQDSDVIFGNEAGHEHITTYAVRNPKAVELIGDEMKKGGELTDDEKSEIYSEWRELINMSASELEKFMNTEEGKEAGLSKDEADELGIKSGRESARWIIKMKKTPNKDWTPTMWQWAKRQIGFVKRMRGNKGDLFDDKGNKTRKHTSLLIWGHNPKK